MTKHKKKYSKSMNIILWIIQTFVAVTFIWAGSMKLFYPEGLPWLWIKENPKLVSISAIFDLLAGFGVFLPALFRIQPKLTIYAAYGIIALMIAASIFHILRGEGSQIGFNIFILVLAIVVAWGRLKKSPIKSKN